MDAIPDGIRSRTDVGLSVAPASRARGADSECSQAGRARIADGDIWWKSSSNHRVVDDFVRFVLFARIQVALTERLAAQFAPSSWRASQCNVGVQ
jgi:hypothetical protein